MELGHLIYGLFLWLIIIAAVAGFVVFIVGISREEKNNRLTRTGAIIAGIFGLTYFVLDPSGPKKVDSEIHGNYKFVYPSGQVEILTMKDHAFSQQFYLNESEYANNKVQYSNNGNWWTTEEQINFDHWLSICDMRDPENILPTPELSTMLNVYWHPPSSNRKGRIDVFLENGYVLEKTD